MLNGNMYQDTIKGKFCSMTNISNELTDRDEIINISLKPKLMNIAMGLMFIGLVHFYFSAALKSRFMNINI